MSTANTTAATLQKDLRENFFMAIGIWNVK